MPTFKLHKLIRDNLLDEFARLDQHADYQTISHGELAAALRQKILEEAREIPLDGSTDDIAGELADIQQALDDLKRVCKVSDEAVAELKRKKYAKRGGFLSGVFVETLELQDDDEWVGYYRSNPTTFPELSAHSSSAVDLAPGAYKHYKGKLYDVVGVGTHTETEEAMVVYRPLYDSDVACWVRPYAMFVENVTVDGKIIPRFKKVDDNE